MPEDRYMPGPETPAGQEIRLAAGLSDFIKHRRSLRGFNGPMMAALGLVLLIVIVALLVAIV